MMMGIEMEIIGKKIIKNALQEIKLDIQKARKNAKIPFDKAGIHDTNFNEGKIQGIKEAENIIKRGLDKIENQTYHLLFSRGDFKPKGIEHLWRNLAIEEDKKDNFEKICLNIVGVKVYLKFPEKEEMLVCITSEDGRLKVIGTVDM